MKKYILAILVLIVLASCSSTRKHGMNSCDYISKKMSGYDYDTKKSAGYKYK